MQDSNQVPGGIADEENRRRSVFIACAKALHTKPTTALMHIFSSCYLEKIPRRFVLVINAKRVLHIETHILLLDLEKMEIFIHCTKGLYTKPTSTLMHIFSCYLEKIRRRFVLVM